jgi:hypothetical protein
MTIDMDDPLMAGGDGSARFAVEFRRANPGCNQQGCVDPGCTNIYHVSYNVMAAVKDYRLNGRAGVELIEDVPW